MFALPAFIPSPSVSVWQLGPFPLRAYALCILVGIFQAVWLGNRRFIARGGLDGQVTDIAMWAVPFGVVGGRLYHVMTDWEIYFSEGGKGFLGALRIWEGGLGIWGAIALGGVGAWIGAKRQGVAFAPFADSIAPGVAFAQAIGRFGNWFNQELFGRPTTLPWGLEIDTANRPTNFTQFDTFHPTFLYEAIACTLIGLFLLRADKRYVMVHGRVFALYVAM
jgi:prolipoprotein diacylglyceryl transferase